MNEEIKYGTFGGAFRERSRFNPFRYILGKYKKDKRMTAFVESRLISVSQNIGVKGNVVNVYRGKMKRVI